MKKAIERLDSPFEFELRIEYHQILCAKMMLHYVISCYIIVYRVLLLCYIYILSYVVLFIMVCHIILYCVILLCHIVVYHIVQHTLYIIERVLEFCFFPAQKFATKSAMRRS